MYVNVRLTIGTLNHAFLIPQAALLRDAKGPYVLTIGSDSKAIQTHITTDTTNGQNWIVSKGLNDGDRIIVSGTQSARPESLVNAVPYVAPDAPPAAASSVAAPTSSATHAAASAPDPGSSPKPAHQ
jgi:membrane fusion protein (multidrug efflux system)